MFNILIKFSVIIITIVIIYIYKKYCKRNNINHNSSARPGNSNNINDVIELLKSLAIEQPSVISEPTRKVYNTRFRRRLLESL